LTPTDQKGQSISLRASPVNAPDPIKAMDVDMLAIMGGHKRISEEFAADLTAGRVLPQGSRISLLEAFSNLKRRP
jgi:hypothetical protein